MDLLFPGPPSAPRNLSVDATGATYVSFYWSPPMDSGGTYEVLYLIYYQAVNVSLRMTLGSVTATSAMMTNMFPDTVYNITVVADNGISGDELKRSASISVKTQSLSTSKH